MSRAHEFTIHGGPRVTPRFSVVVPAYNADQTLTATLDSLLAQEFTDWECVVVDDGSQDQTARIVEVYRDRDSRFRLVQQENGGTAAANNAGVTAASSDLLVICAADDFLLPAHLMIMDDLIRRNSDCGIFSSNGTYLDDETGASRPARVGVEWSQERSLTLPDVLRACFYSVGAVFRREAFALAGGFRDGVYVDDYDLWLRAMARGVRHRYTPEILSVHRVSSVQKSASVLTVREWDARVIEDLIASGVLGGKDLAVAQTSARRHRRNLRIRRAATSILGSNAEHVIAALRGTRLR